MKLEEIFEDFPTFGNVVVDCKPYSQSDEPPFSFSLRLGRARLWEYETEAEGTGCRRPSHIVTEVAAKRRVQEPGRGPSRAGYSEDSRAAINLRADSNPSRDSATSTSAAKPGREPARCRG